MASVIFKTDCTYINYEDVQNITNMTTFYFSSTSFNEPESTSAHHNLLTVYCIDCVLDRGKERAELVMSFGAI